MKPLIFLNFAFLLQIQAQSLSSHEANIFRWASTGMSFDSPTVFNLSFQQPLQRNLKKSIFKYDPKEKAISPTPAFLGGKHLLQDEGEFEVHVYGSAKSLRADLLDGERYFFRRLLNHPHTLEEEWLETLCTENGTIATEAFYRAAPLQVYMPDDQAPLEEDLLQQMTALKGIPFTDNNFHLFKDFFDDYGPYYVARLTLGGLFRQVGTIDRKFFKKVLKSNETRLEELVQANLAYTLGLGPRPKELLDPEDSKMVNSFENIAYGGDLSLVASDPPAWLKSLNQSNLVPVQVVTDRVNLLKPFESGDWQSLNRALEYAEVNYKLERLRALFVATQVELDSYDFDPDVEDHNPLEMLELTEHYLEMSPTELIADLEGGPIAGSRDSEKSSPQNSTTKSRKTSGSYSGTVMRSSRKPAESGSGNESTPTYHTFERDFLPKVREFMHFHVSWRGVFSDFDSDSADPDESFGNETSILEGRANKKYFMEKEEEEEFYDSDRNGQETIVRKKKKKKITRNQNKKGGKGRLGSGKRRRNRGRKNFDRDDEEDDD